MSIERASIDRAGGAVRVLIVDDDTLLLDELRMLFEGEGYDVTAVDRRSEALAQLEEDDWHLVLLDQKLDGAEGPDRGLELIDDVRMHAPGARIIVLTGYASPASIARAFEAGVDDFIEKKGAFGDILKHKVRQATDVARERRNHALRADEREQRLAEAWVAARTETDVNRKGLALEETMRLLLQTMPGFAHVRARLSNGAEEIDLLVRNASTDPFWSRQSDYLLVECKNWSGRVGARDFREFLTKMKNRYGRCRLGLLVSMGGFTEKVRDELLSKREGDHLVLLIDHEGLDRLVRTPASDRLACLTRLHDRSIVAVNGMH